MVWANFIPFGMHCIALTCLDWTDATKVQGSEACSLIFGICMGSGGKLITSALLPLVLSDVMGY